jgi:uncharacterized protein (UPF0264 family)
MLDIFPYRNIIRAGCGEMVSPSDCGVILTGREKVMKTLWICAVVSVSAVILGLGAAAEDKPAPKAGAKNAAFEKIKTLVGTWEVTGEPGEHAKHGGTVTYKVTAGGSAVLETLFGGTDHEMVSLYYVEGKDLAMTHYCMLQNRPHMRAERQSSPDKIVFKCHEADNREIEGEDHMHQATFTFVDADHLKTEWILYKEGKPDSTHAFELARKKK